MKLVAGLGNPGRTYQGTRHNAGFAVVDELSRRTNAAWRYAKDFNAEWAEASIGGAPVKLLKPLTFMNLSGASVGPVVRFYKLELPSIMIVVDDMDLPTGTLRIRSNGSAGGQKGLADVIRALGSDQFPRLRVGIGRSSRGDSVRHVLSRFAPDERQAMDDAIRLAADAVQCWVLRGIDAAMNDFNRKKNEPSGGGDNRRFAGEEGDSA